jgi:hypothetical protein
MPSRILTNRYRFPQGYRSGVFNPAQYLPWNGFNSGNNSPGAFMLGAVLDLIATGVPTDLQTLQFTDPRTGFVYVFQFVYAAGVWNQGIKIPLPNSGSSTAAQVITAVAGVLGLASGVTFAGDTVSFPWAPQQVNSTTYRLNFLVPGNPGPSVTPANMTQTLSTPYGTTQLGVVSPAVAGRGFATLPGS